MIKLGVNSVLFAGLDFATACRLTKLCGYDGIEVSAIAGMCEHLVLDRWQEQADEIRKTAADNGLALLSMEVASLDEARLEKAFAAGKAIGIPLINVGPGGKANEPGAVEQAVATLISAAQLAAKYNVTVCCKAHVGSSILQHPHDIAGHEGHFQRQLWRGHGSQPHLAGWRRAGRCPPTGCLASEAHSHPRLQRQGPHARSAKRSGLRPRRH